MKLTTDKENDAIYFRIDDSKIIESEEIQKDIILDYNESGEIVGVEILNVSHRKNNVSFNTLQFESNNYDKL